MTHADLVNIAYRWVLANASCGVAFRELNAAVCNNEEPDVIGFGNGCHSVIVECKACAEVIGNIYEHPDLLSK